MDRLVPFSSFLLVSLTVVLVSISSPLATAQIVVTPYPTLGPSSGTPSPTVTPGDFNTVFEERQNRLRRLHQAPDLIFDQKLREDAKLCADEYSKNDGVVTTESCKGPGILFAKYRNNDPPADQRPAALALIWYNQVKNVNFADLKYDQNSRDFRQLVWVATKQFGCDEGIEQVEADGTTPFNYIVCKYDPPGNWEMLEGALDFPATFPTQNLRENVRPFTGRVFNTTHSQ